MIKLSIAVITVTFAAVACTNSTPPESAPTKETPVAATGASDIGVGPISSVVLEKDINKQLAKKGEDIFSSKCSACHKVDERYVGPALKGVTLRRKPEWIMNMILNPQEMIEKDATAKELLGEFMVPMTFQNVDQDQARAILEYFRSNDQK